MIIAMMNTEFSPIDSSAIISLKCLGFAALIRNEDLVLLAFVGGTSCVVALMRGNADEMELSCFDELKEAVFKPVDTSRRAVDEVAA